MLKKTDTRNLLGTSDSFIKEGKGLFHVFVHSASVSYHPHLVKTVR